MPRSRKQRAARAAKKPPAKKPHGGSRPGAGRKRDKLPADVIERIGKPGETPSAIRLWNARLLAEVQLLSMRGGISVDLAASLRANAGAIDRALPVERSPVDPDDDDENEDGDGPELVPVNGDGSLRVG